MDKEPTIEHMQQFVSAVNQAAEQVVNVLQPVIDATIVFTGRFTEVMQPFVEASVTAIQNFSAAIYGEYLKAGAPYGETQEGCTRSIP